MQTSVTQHAQKEKKRKIYKAILLERAQSTRLMTLTGVHTPLRHGGSTYVDHTKHGVLPGFSNDCESNTCCHTTGICDGSEWGRPRIEVFG